MTAADKPAITMSIREHYAGLALNGLLACTANTDAQPRHFAADAVAMADALLAELERAREHVQVKEQK